MTDISKSTGDSLEVIRFPSEEKQTLGMMQVLSGGATIFKCHTLELPWKENKNRISCIPTGAYICKKREATENIPYKHILITNVSGRSGVCIHKGNYFTQILGCIIVGDSHTDINKDGYKDVTNSGKTFDALMAILPDEFKLTIK